MKIIATISVLSIMGFFSSLFETQKEIPVQVIEFETPIIITPSR